MLNAIMQSVVVLRVMAPQQGFKRYASKGYQHNGSQYNHTQHNNKNTTLDIKTISIITQDAECHYA
jgi:hypothetical protein